MVTRSRLICASADLTDGGKGVRFMTTHKTPALRAKAFAIRYDGRVYAYVNNCAHKPSELDWIAGEFFDANGLYLICATHGANYEPDTGLCVTGPCVGASLIPVVVEERDGNVYVIDEMIESAE